MTAKTWDLHHDSKGVTGLATTTINSNTTTNGASVDRSGYTAVEWFVLSATLTDGAYALGIDESDDNSAWSAASSDDILGDGTSFADTDDDTVKRIGYHGNKRYARLTITSTGVTSGGDFTSIAVKAQPAHAPVADD